VKPLLSDEEFESTKKKVQEFMEPGGVGELVILSLQQDLLTFLKLQKKLKERDASGVPSWLEEFWDDAYLFGRESIAINVNYFFVFEDDPVKEKNTQIGRAASLLRGAMLFKEKLDR
jgi:carnitine O-acetyltransferase